MSPTTLAPGTRLGPYEILSAIGAGGMGEVYRANDTRLGRHVAVKTLSPDIAQDVEFRQRFDREARALASLSHPHICPVFDVGSHEGTAYIVMEFLEGETLADRLKRGAIPVREALARAIEIADALDKAHRRGIVHRDLKPGNVMLATSGSARPGAPQVKLLDFGLAKAMASPDTRAASPEGATTTPPLTGRGMVLGTVQYMAPEQVEGLPADARSDIFSFGAVLYEMLTGACAFGGRSPVSVMAAILEHHPKPLGEVQPMTPPSLDRLVRRCLAKDPDERWQHAGDILSELRWIAESTGTTSATSQTAGTATAPVRAHGLGIGLASAAAIVSAVLGGSAVLVFRPSAPAETPRLPARATIQPGEGVRLSNYAQPGSSVEISADGKRIVFVGFRGAQTMLFRHELETGETSPIEGTEGARGPFLSPDGLWVAYQQGSALQTANGQLQRASVYGGQVTTVVSAPGERAGAWLPDNRILMSSNPVGIGGSTVAPSGSQPLRLLAPGEAIKELSSAGLAASEALIFPQPLPGNAGAIVTSRQGAPGSPSWHLKWVGIAGGVRELVANAYFGRYVESGHLLYTTGLGRLVAQRFDTEKLTVTGQPVVVLEDMVTSETSGSAQFSVSRQGTLVYVAGSADRTSRMPVSVDRAGRETPLATETRAYGNLAASPDGKSALLYAQGTNLLVWLLDVARGTSTPLSSGPPGPASAAAWVNDGVALLAKREQDDRVRIVRLRLADRSEETIFTAPGSGPLRHLSVARNGLVVFAYSDPGGSFDIWTMPIANPADAKPWMATAAREDTPHISPDGSLIAFVSNQNGRFEVYVAPTRQPGSAIRVSPDGGLEPLFARSGEELFYRRGDEMWSLEIGAKGTTVEAGTPTLLFRGRQVRQQEPPGRAYGVSADGSRFFMLKDEQDQSDEIRVIFNFFELLTEKAP